MSRTFLAAYILTAALATLLSQQASAWGTGGGISNPFKQLPNSDLICDLDDVKSDATIEAKACTGTCPDFVPGGANNPFVFEGNIVCQEVPHGSTSFDFSLSAAPIAVFDMKQVTMDAGMEYSTDNGTEHWDFVVRQGSRNENLLWTLTPNLDGLPQTEKDKITDFYCPQPYSAATCVAKFGVEEKENAHDYPDGVVFSFSVVNDVPLELKWGPCHSGAFDVSADVACQARVGTQRVETRSDGEVQAIVEVEFEFSPTLNVTNSSDSSNLKLIICGNPDVVFDGATGEPADTTKPISINGKDVPITGFLVNSSNSGVCGGGGADLNLQLDRSKAIKAVTPCTGPNDPVRISGHLIGGGKFGGLGTIPVKNCE